jgi:hypothetical protein
MTHRKSRLTDRRGVALAFVALLLFVFLGLAAFAVDLGLVYGARTEAQRSADAAALAGAGVLLETMDETSARNAAIDWGQRNLISRTGFEIRPEDVDVEMDNQLVRVRVHRTELRDSAIPMIFGRAIGIPTANVSAVAAARAFPAGGIETECAFPFALPDRWRKGDGNWPGISDNYDQAAGDVYVPLDQPNTTGYTEDDIGFRIQIRGQQPNAVEYQPGFWRQVWFWEQPGQGSVGQPQIWDAIRGCTGRDFRPAFIGDQLSQIAPGVGSAGQQRAAFNAVVNSDEHLRWDYSCNCFHRGDGVPVSAGETERIRPIALFDPRVPVPNGAGELRIINFVYVFVERYETETGPGSSGQPSVWVRYAGGSGLAMDNFNPDVGPVIRTLRLVE